MKPLHLARDFNADVFNALDSVEDANRSALTPVSRSETRRSKFLAEASGIFIKHGMEETFGLALLHNHYDCTNGKVVVEHEEVVDGCDALVTVELGLDRVGVVCPTVWKVSDTGFEVVALSCEAKAAQIFRDAAVTSAFLCEFAELVRKSGAEALFGLAIVERDLFDRATADEAPIELSILADKRNIVSLRNAADYMNQTIQTSWSFHAATNAEAEIECHSSCRTQCWNTSDGGHVPEHTPHHT